MYFDNKGKINTERCVELAIKTARERNIKNIVVATCSGYTAKFFEGIKDLNIICVTHAYGYGSLEEDKKLNETREELKSKGFQVLTTAHILSGAERGLSKKFGGISPVEVMAHTLRMFGQGTKVCVEIGIMALDCGLIPFGEEIIAVGGSGEGADSVIIMTPAHANNLLDTKINEIICKPKYF